MVVTLGPVLVKLLAPKPAKTVHDYAETFSLPTFLFVDFGVCHHNLISSCYHHLRVSVSQASHLSVGSHDISFKSHVKIKKKNMKEKKIKEPKSFFLFCFLLFLLLLVCLFLFSQKQT